jgi:3-oxoacyl-[acyl-carrier-protein] synthase-3
VRASVLGLGQHFPDTVRDNSAWPAEFVKRSLERMGDRTLVDIPTGGEHPCQRIAASHLAKEATDPFLGSTRRRVDQDGTTASDAEAHAARAALEDAGVDPVDLDVVLSWSIVPDRLCPPNACRVSHALGATRAWAMGVDAACASVVTQLSVAAALIESGRARTVLLTQSHWVTRAMPWMHPASPNLGDAASAMVVGATETAGIRATHAVTEGQHYEAVTWCRGKTSEADPPWWLAGGPFYIGSLDPAGAQMLMQDTVRIGAATIGELLERTKVSPKDIGAIASVQPRRWVPGAIAEGIGVDPALAPQTFDDYAHLGGVGVVINLMAARERKLLTRGSQAVLYAQGAGFTRGAALLAF